MLVVAAVSFLVAVAEGYYYFSAYKSFPLWQLLLVLQNGIKTFLFMPQISIEAVLKQLSSISMSPLQYMVAHAYIVAVFLAPVCTVTSLLSVVNAFYHVKNFLNRLFDKEHYVVFGYDEDVVQILKNSREALDKRVRIHIVVSGVLTKEKELELIKYGAVVHYENLFQQQKENRQGLAKLFTRIQLTKASHVFLLNKEKADNFSLYILLAENGSLLVKNATVHCLCENEEMQKLLMNFHDEQKDKLDLDLFCISQLQVRNMFLQHPIYQYQLEHMEDTSNPDWDAHLLLIGLGSVGTQVLNQMLNLVCWMDKAEL